MSDPTNAVLEQIAKNLGSDYDQSTPRKQIDILEEIAENTEGGTGGGGTLPSASQVKTLYEQNANTNAYTDAEKTKLSGIADGATKNQADSTLLDRANHTGTQAQSTIAGLSTVLDAKASLSAPAFTGDVTATGNLTAALSLVSRRTATGASVIIDSPAATLRAIYMRSSGSERFRIGVTADAESGSNAGSIFTLARYSDTGAGLGTSISVSRSTGEVTLEQLTSIRPAKLGAYTLSTLPSAAAYANCIITVTNATGGTKICWSNGTNWCLLNTSTAVN